MIGAYRFFYNQGVSYLHDLPRGFYIPKSVSKKGTQTTQPNFIRYEGQFYRVETGGTHCFGVIPTYDSAGKRLAPTSFQSIRNHLQAGRPKWFSDGRFPSHLIDQAAREVAFNFVSIIERRRNDKKPFRMEYKSKTKSVTQTITFEGSSLKKKTMSIYPQVFKGIDTRIKLAENVNFLEKTEYKISYNRKIFDYSISLPIKSVEKPFTGDQKSWCSIDPGEISFAAIYNPQQCNVVLACNKTRKKDTFRMEAKAALQSKISKCKDKRIKRSLKQAYQRYYRQDEHRRHDLHHKVADYLCSNFKHIIVPSYGVKNMKGLCKSVNGSMRNLGFFQFLTFLKHKSKERGNNLYIVDEYYTSQACCNCGNLSKPNDRKYHCKKCGLDIHRDANASVNIGLKHTVINTVVSE
jgi:transposase